MASNRFWHIVSVVKEQCPPVLQKGYLQPLKYVIPLFLSQHLIADFHSCTRHRTLDSHRRSIPLVLDQQPAAQLTVALNSPSTADTISANAAELTRKPALYNAPAPVPTSPRRPDRRRSLGWRGFRRPSAAPSRSPPETRCRSKRHSLQSQTPRPRLGRRRKIRRQSRRQT